MARSKHRKDHRKAVQLRKTMKALEDAALPPHPVEVGKKKFKIVGDGPDTPVTPEEIAALPEIRVSSSVGVEPGDVLLVRNAEGKPFYARVAPAMGVQAFVDGQEVPVAGVGPEGVTLETAPPKDSEVRIVGIDPASTGDHSVVTLVNKNGDHYAFDALSADYSNLEARIAANLGLPAEQIEALSKGRFHRAGMSLGALRGHTKHLMAIDDYSHYEGVPEVKGLDGPLLPGVGHTAEGTIDHVVLSPMRGPTRPIFHLDEDLPGLLHRIETCSICGSVWPCANHAVTDFSMGCTPEDRPGDTTEGTVHLEPVWKCDAEGKPCGIEEISLCPGPDPNGLTTIKPEERP